VENQTLDSNPMITEVARLAVMAAVHAGLSWQWGMLAVIAVGHVDCHGSGACWGCHNSGACWTVMATVHTGLSWQYGMLRFHGMLGLSWQQGTGGCHDSRACLNIMAVGHTGPSWQKCRSGLSWEVMASCCMWWQYCTLGPHSSSQWAIMAVLHAWPSCQ
jgi:hypothetical protein